MSETQAWLIWALPLAAFVLISLGVPTGIFRGAPKLAGLLSALAMAGSFGLSIVALQEVWDNHGASIGFGTHEWLEVANLTIDIGINIDGLTAMMLVVVTSVSLLVQIYSIGYMDGDRGFPRYFALISLFTVSMLGLVLADNVLMIFVFWELVGLCSYLLIGFWFDRNSAVADQLPPRTAAKKAFLVTRAGDVGFLLALILIWTKAGTFNIPELFEIVERGDLSQTVLLLFCLGIFAGAAGKSAQFPLHTWLPDAMAGPTPVSALIHAATMVAAGVYLVGRLFPIFEYTDHALTVVTYIGAITAVLAATMGMVSNDIKRVLAYSTISQLGYMMLALGVGGYIAAFFHLMTHAFFKALLFLGSGSVNHGTNTFDMREMGGLWRFQPITFITFVIGSLSLAGVFPLAGFWSKDEILKDAWNQNQIAFWMAMAVVFMTAYYMFRAVSMTFLGEYRGGGTGAGHGDDDAHAAAVPALALAHAGGGHDTHGHSAVNEHDAHAQPAPVSAAAHGDGHDDAHGGHGGGHGNPHESPFVMWAPLAILTVPAIVAGFVNAGDPYFGYKLEELLHGSLPEFVELHHYPLNWGVLLGSLGLAVLGVLSALVMYGFGSRVSVPVGPLKPLYALANRKYFLDELYELVIVRGLFFGVITGIARFIDTRVIDGIVNGSARLTRLVSSGLARVQNGQQQAYGLVFAAGVVVLAAVMLAANT